MRWKINRLSVSPLPRLLRLPMMFPLSRLLRLPKVEVRLQMVLTLRLFRAKEKRYALTLIESLLPCLLYRSFEIWRCVSMLVLQMLNRRRPHLRLVHQRQHGSPMVPVSFPPQARLHLGKRSSTDGSSGRARSRVEET